MSIKDIVPSAEYDKISDVNNRYTFTEDPKSALASKQSEDSPSKCFFIKVFFQMSLLFFSVFKR